MPTIQELSDYISLYFAHFGPKPYHLCYNARHEKRMRGGAATKARMEDGGWEMEKA
jgi:hypothetical protein